MNLLTLFCDVIGKFVSKFVAGLLVILIVDVSWQVITRFLLERPSSFTEEIARFLLIWISMLGAAVAYRHADHLGFDLLVSKTKPTTQTIIRKMNALLALIFGVVVLCIGGGNVVYIVYSMEQFSSVLGINMAYIYMVLPIAGLLFVLFALERFMSTTDALSNEPNKSLSDDQKGAQND
ncbi:TRAP transporter small permease [Psychrosphaera sp. B3R10]|uniref:TRAP transporter small permease n=1 Tax=unclassified Psychrosphaera TaxID=2641570 RepID=UPI001C08EA75|nr:MULTISPECIES: TRAP transporter small permease [unclassified Psychrosphaera]MBU2881038.1 TRAP transporter small permease [Psychrosphaera sp. I2R16]MBU2989962.1 TRAP transporter small permease [Psychrosphaera sp. B3R10]MDO6719147.1 TRAP transporter small permease [Psychrosphaera sp. 1_MG-2023]